MSDADLTSLLATPIAMEGRRQPFGSLTRDQVAARATELRAAVGFGPTVRVAPVARAWRELELELTRMPAATVADLPAEVIERLAPQLWVVPPGGSLL